MTTYYHCKGSRRKDLDYARLTEGEPKKNMERNTTLNSHYDPKGKATRKKGRNRFRTGHKGQRKGKTVKVV